MEVKIKVLGQNGVMKFHEDRTVTATVGSVTVNFPENTLLWDAQLQLEREIMKEAAETRAALSAD